MKMIPSNVGVSCAFCSVNTVEMFTVFKNRLTDFCKSFDPRNDITAISLRVPYVGLQDKRSIQRKR